MSLTDFKVSVIEKDTAGRVVIVALDPEMVQYLKNHTVCVISQETGLPIRITEQKPIATYLLPDVVRAFQRCADDILQGRTKGSLATADQLSRARQLDGILVKRAGNKLRLPDDCDTWSIGELGRWIRDTKIILMTDGLWDDTNKHEIVKG